MIVTRETEKSIPAVREKILIERVWKLDLQSQRLKSRKCGADAKIQFFAQFHGVVDQLI